MTKQILLATTNKNKVKRIKLLLEDLPVEIMSLDDMGITAPEPEETAPTCVGIAAQKALAYVEYVDAGIPVLTQDDTIVFEGVEEKDNPGTAIKEPVEKQFGKFTDKNAFKYYTELASKYGGTIPMTFHYGHAIAIKSNTNRVTITLQGAESTLATQLVNTIHKPELVPGYFLAAIMRVQLEGKWRNYTDLDDKQLSQADYDLRESIVGLLKNTGIINKELS